MASTLTKILLHVTFSTKARAAMIPVELGPRLHAYVGGICRRFDSPLLAMGGVADHVHLFISLGKTASLSDLMLNIKRDTSKWMKEQHDGPADFAWQDGYFAFSIGESGAPALRAYIADQREHHRHVDFKTEVRAFLRKYGVEWDEQHVWS